MELKPEEKIESLMIGDYKIIQSQKLYRFTSDAINLSRFAKAQKGEVVGDLCAGSGIVGLHFYALNDQRVKSVDFFELQKPLSDMCKKSIELNNLSGKANAYNVPIQEIGEEFFNKYSLLFCNPPYKKQLSGIISERDDIAICKHEITVCLDDIALCAKKLLMRGGRICLCNKCERLVDTVVAFNKVGLSIHRIAFLKGSEKNKPYLFLIEAFKGISKQLIIEESVINSIKNFSGIIDL